MSCNSHRLLESGIPPRFSAPSFRKTCRPSSPPTAYEQETCVSDFFLRPKLECTLQSDPGFRGSRPNASKPDILDSMHLILLDVHQLQPTPHPPKHPADTHFSHACIDVVANLMDPHDAKARRTETTAAYPFSHSEHRCGVQRQNNICLKT